MESIIAWLTNVEQFMEWELTGETEVLAENSLLCPFAHHKSIMTWLGIKLVPPHWEVADEQFILCMSFLRYLLFSSEFKNATLSSN
jgi:hypothetical protein